MARINRFEELEAWKLARELTNLVYSFARRGEFSRDFGLRDQICRSSVSVMSNIAEGFERDGDREFANFLSMSKGSLGEVRAQLYVARDQGYISAEEFDAAGGLALQTGRVISGLIRYLRGSSVSGIKFRGNETASSVGNQRPETRD
jgi:four helix bundle protein